MHPGILFKRRRDVPGSDKIITTLIKKGVAKGRGAAWAWGVGVGRRRAASVFCIPLYPNPIGF